MAVSLVAAVLMVSFAEIVAQPGMPPPMMPMQLPDSNLTSFRLPPPPRLIGALARNSWLAKVQKYKDGAVSGPESMVVVNRYIYTGMSDGWVIEINPKGVVRRLLKLSYSNCGRRITSEAVCGRPLGIRADYKRKLVVVDAYKGIFRIDPKNPRRYEWLVKANNVNNKGIRLLFFNDLALAKSGLIFFTSSSAIHQRSEFMNIILEGDKSGQVLVYNPKAPKTSQVSVLARNIHFPNGLELARDESYLLVAEGARARIHRIWLKTEKKGTIDTFADNLPGFIDNIRRSPRGTYWVAISSVRYHENPGVLDKHGPNPRIRQLILSMPEEEIMARAPKYGMVVELNANGKIIRSLHDPSGIMYTAVSEVEEEKGLLFFGSFKNKFIGVLPMRDLPPPIEPSAPVTQGPPVRPPPTSNPQVNALNHVRTIVSTMSKEKLMDIILVLMRRFLEVRMDSIRAVERANRLQQQLNEATQLDSSATVTGRTLTTEFNGDASSGNATTTMANNLP